MRTFDLRNRRPLLKRAGVALAWMLLFIAAAAITNLVGIRMAGDIQSWEAWLRQQSLWFLIWRLVLYAGIVAGWIWMRRRVLAREPDGATGQRLRRLEIAAVTAFVMLETSLLLQRS